MKLKHGPKNTISLFEQHPIKTPDGEISVSFWDSGDYSMKLEHDMKNNQSDLGYGGPMMGGM